MLLNFIDLP